MVLTPKARHSKAALISVEGGQLQATFVLSDMARMTEGMAYMAIFASVQITDSSQDLR